MDDENKPFKRAKRLKVIEVANSALSKREIRIVVTRIRREADKLFGNVDQQKRVVRIKKYGRLVMVVGTGMGSQPKWRHVVISEPQAEGTAHGPSTVRILAHGRLRKGLRTVSTIRGGKDWGEPPPPPPPPKKHDLLPDE